MALLLSYSLRSLWVRRSTGVASLLGIALVVFVLLTSRMLALGMSSAMQRSGKDGRVLVMSSNSWSEVGSRLEHAAVSLIGAAPGIGRSPGGDALVMGEYVTQVLMRHSGDPGRFSTLQLRGVSPNVWLVRSEAKIVEGRALTPGTDEAVIGRSLVKRYEGFDIGGRIEFAPNRKITIVGTFESSGSAYESEIWGDLDSVRSSLGRQGYVSSVTAQLESPAGYDALGAALAGNRQFGFDVAREPEYYLKVSRGVADGVSTIGRIVTNIFSLCAIFGSMIGLYTAVNQRAREIGVLRAIGFGRSHVMSVFMVESVALAVVGTALGVGFALLSTFVDFPTTNAATGQEIVFRFMARRDLVLESCVAGVALGLIAGFVPAARAARRDPLQNLRA